jgi:hypothetical protein
MKFFLAASATLLLLGPLSQSAFSYNEGESCYVKQTSDGFVALRTGPRVTAKRIRKLNGDYRVSPIGPIRAWVKIRATEMTDDETIDTWSGKGYVRSDLIDWSSCNNAG